MQGIYAIFGNDGVYVGQSIDVFKRMICHKSLLESGNHYNSKLSKAFQNNNLFFVPLEEVSDLEMLTDREQFWIDSLDSCWSGYNICPVAQSVRGNKLTDSQRQSLSEVRKKQWEDEEYRERMTIKIQETRRSPEGRASAREVANSLWSKDSFREKMSEAQKERRSNHEDRKKTSESLKKHFQSEGARKNRSEQVKKRYEDPEQRKKQSEISKKKWADPEFRKKMMEARNKGH